MLRRGTAPIGLLVGFLLILTLFALPGTTRAAGCDATTVRWASSSNSLYVTGPVTCTLSELQPLTKAPLTQVDPAGKIWLLGANLRLEQGATLQLHGSEVGGDVNELRLRSNNTSDATSTIFIRADWGNISMRNTKVTSWDEAKNAPDTEYGTYKRSFIHVRSSLDADGVTPHQSRMDIVDSDVGYLGHAAAEAYGLTWKVSGVPGPFDKVDVLGDVTGSKIHHNYFGIYTYGAGAMKFLNNEINNNVQYGLDPHDDSDNLLIEGNYSHHNGNHGIICSKRCNNLTIRGNRSEYNTGHGIMLHRLVTDTVVENNTVIGNSDAGIPIFDSSGNTVRGNTVSGNRYGIRLSVGANNNLIENNTVSNNTASGFYFYKGSDAPTSGDGRPKFNRFVGNQVTGSKEYAIKLTDADDNSF
ncbi:MAG TPA: right-handed parallel beta-helix repeat-containing protein, partial [Candidatus Saccharimonadales bacterium]|nr:right-handed parallel beta-helix repeat-containing protein [Candidatus Saccharimonadales bacterium]